MAKVLNFGSLNVDHVYKVKNFVRAGETILCDDYQRFAGGKGLNQSIALAHAGAQVFHAGKVGGADTWLTALLNDHGVNTRFAETMDGPSGHAIIQVNAAGENSIVIFGGANRLIAESDVQRALEEFTAGDYLLVQNEINRIPHIIRAANNRDMKIVFNPAPMSAEVQDYPLDQIDILIVNETEGMALSGEEQPDRICTNLCQRYPRASVILTMGEKGAVFQNSQERIHQPAERVHAIDTTAAGDTFIGFFLAEFIRTEAPSTALAYACRAAAICATRPGAAPSIPQRKDIENFINGET